MLPTVLFLRCCFFLHFIYRSMPFTHPFARPHEAKKLYIVKKEQKRGGGTQNTDMD